METCDHDVTPGTREHFLQVTQLQRWGTIQEYVDLCRLRGYFTEAFYRRAVTYMERIHVRRMLRQVREALSTYCLLMRSSARKVEDPRQYRCLRCR